MDSLENNFLLFLKDDSTPHFTTFLPYSLELNDHDWEVALTDIVLPDYSNKLSCENYVFYIGNSDDREKLQLISGEFSSIPELVAMINAEITKKQAGTLVSLHYNEKTYKIDFSFATDNWYFELESQPLASLLGCISGKRYTKKDHSGDRSPNLRDANQLLFVHCDIMNESIHGNSLLDLLRVVPIPEQVSSSQQLLHPVEFGFFHYFPVKFTRISKISITLRNKYGNLFGLTQVCFTQFRV